VSHIEVIVMSFVSAGLAWWVKLIGGRVSDMPRDYVPRVQIDARFRDLEQRIEREMNAQESRTEKRFDAIDGKLDKIIDRLERKADRQ